MVTNLANPAVFARVVPAVLLLPLGSWPARLLLAGVAGATLASLVPAAPAGPFALLGEAALGALLGVLAGIPVHAAYGLRGLGPPTLGFAGRVWAWAIFFGTGGPLLLLSGLGASFATLPPGAAWPSVATVAQATEPLLYAALVLGLPTWLTALLLAPLAGLLERVGVAGSGHALLGTRVAAALLLLALLLPVLLDEVRVLWLAALVPLGGAPSG